MVDTMVPAPPGPLSLPSDKLTIVFDEPIDPDTVTSGVVYAIGSDGTLVNTSAVPEIIGDRTLECLFDDLGCAPGYSVRISNLLADLTGYAGAGGQRSNSRARDAIAPEIDCPAMVFVNSTIPYGIRQKDLADLTVLETFLTGVDATDNCGVTAVENSFDLRNGPSTRCHDRDFLGRGRGGERARCDATLIVVPAVPLACWDLNENGVGDPKRTSTVTGSTPPMDCQGPR